MQQGFQPYGLPQAHGAHAEAGAPPSWRPPVPHAHRGAALGYAPQQAAPGGYPGGLPPAHPTAAAAAASMLGAPQGTTPLAHLIALQHRLLLQGAVPGGLPRPPASAAAPAAAHTQAAAAHAAMAQARSYNPYRMHLLSCSCSAPRVSMSWAPCSSSHVSALRLSLNQPVCDQAVLSAGLAPQQYAAMGALPHLLGAQAGGRPPTAPAAAGAGSPSPATGAEWARAFHSQQARQVTLCWERSASCRLDCHCSQHHDATQHQELSFRFGT